jgi:hypothetical protein
MTTPWTIPINVVVAKLSTFGPFPASYRAGLGVFPAHPDVGPTWKLRAAIVLLFRAHDVDLSRVRERGYPDAVPRRAATANARKYR